MVPVLLEEVIAAVACLATFDFEIAAKFGQPLDLPLVANLDLQLHSVLIFLATSLRRSDGKGSYKKAK